VDRAAAWLELAETLWKSGNQRQARAEINSMRVESGWSRATLHRLGALLLAYGMADRAADVFGALVREDPRDADAFANLGEAAFALREYRMARDSWRQAVELNPADLKTAARLEVAERILALDPTVEGLSLAGKRTRERALVAAIEAMLAQCGSKTEPARPPARHSAHTDYPGLARQLWDSRNQVCRGAPPPDEALSRVMANVLAPPGAKEAVSR
jgi:tetratricopeptide (TPR) repeat protein